MGGARPRGQYVIMHPFVFVGAFRGEGNGDAAAGQIVFTAFWRNAGQTFDIEAPVLDE